jgi:large subunit ribosomal protein L9
LKNAEEAMKIILRQDYNQLGKIGDVVTVRDGYARNFLIPNGIAITANPKNMKILEEDRKNLDRRLNKEKHSAEKLAKELEAISLTAAVAVGEEDRVFGSVTAQNIADLLKEKGFEIDKRKIQLEEPIKALGIYTIIVKLHADVETKIRVWVVKE